jgi:hypothetical protein
VHVAGVDEHHLEAALFEDLVDRYLIDPGRFHRHGLDPALSKPVGQTIKFAGEGAKLVHRLRVTVGLHCYEMVLFSAVKTARVGLDAFEQ